MLWYFGRLVILITACGAVSLGATRDLLVGSWSTHAIRRYDGETQAFLGNFVVPGSGGLNLPDGMDFGADGNLYVSSSNTNSILRFDGNSGDFLDVFASDGLAAPGNLKFGPDGLLYVANKNTGSVLRFHPDTGQPLGVFASGGGLQQPVGLLWTQNELLVSDFAGNAIRRYDAVTGAFAGNFATVATPLILNLDANANVLVSSHNASTIFRFDSSGTPLGPFLSGGPINCPVGYVFDDLGQMVVASWQNNRILRYDAASGAYLGPYAAGNGLRLPNDLLWMPVPEPGGCCLVVVGYLSWMFVTRRYGLRKT